MLTEEVNATQVPTIRGHLFLDTADPAKEPLQAETLVSSTHTWYDRQTEARSINENKPVNR